MAAAIWTRLLASLRFLGVRPGARGWRLSFRVVAVGVAAALLTAGLAAAPAHAAPVTPAGSPAPAGAGTGRSGSGSSTATTTAALTTTAATTTAAVAAAYPDPIVAHLDYPSYDPAETTAAIDYWWPESLGLPDNSSLSQLVSGTWGLWQQQNPPSSWLPPKPANLSAASISVTSDGGKGSILSLTVPLPPGAGGVTTSGLNPVLAAVLSELAGVLAATGTFMVCGAFLFGIPGNDSGWQPDYGKARPWTKPLCNGALTAVWAGVATIVDDIATTGNAPTTKFPYASVLGFVLGGAAAGYGFPYAGSLVKVLQYAWLGVSFWLANASIPVPVRLIGWLTPYLTTAQWDQVLEFAGSFAAEQVQQMSSPLTAASLFGLWTPAASGLVGNVPTGAVVTVGSGDCMDAYETTQTEPALPPAVPGQPVAINACDGKPSQVFTFWPNGQIENWGMCMDDNGDSSSGDRPVVNLQVCDGGYTQQWYENGAGAIVNAETGNCLDDPGTNTTPGTQLRLYPCNNSSAQVWAPPGGTDAVTGFDRILSVQSSGSSQLCMMPQTSLANPVGSNIITEPATGNVCFSNATGRKWAVGSNGTLMANGTNALCMDSNGPATTGPGGGAAYFIQLQGCDGASSQVWHVVSTYLGPTLQNAADGLCVNTPSGQLGAVVSMVVASCASPPYAGELWTLPGFSAPHGLLAGGPCDIYLYYGTPCGAAYSMDRAMYAGYNGPLYQVKRASDGTTANIGLLAAGGDVNAAGQDSFCASTSCTITEIYDQSAEGNNLTIEQGGGAATAADQGADATALKIKIGGNEAYGLDIEQGTGYRDDTTNGIATGSAPEGMYMVASGTHVNAGCCFDFGNVETDNQDHGPGTMDAVNLTTWCGNNNTFPCSGGPWVEADLENGQWTGSGPNTESASNSDFVTAMLSNNGQNTSNGQNSFELQGGNSQSGGLTTFYNGSLPSGYNPMKKQGAIVLGTGGDNSNTDVGSFFEGVMTAGFPSDAADAAVQANIVAAGYSGSTNPTSTSTAGSSAAGQAVVHAAGATGAAASGFSSVYTVDSANQHLQESYLPYMGDAWTTQDLSATGGTLPGAPPVMPGTQPVALVHCGFTSVFTVDAASGDLQETYLPAIGGAWLTQDLSAKYGTPPTNQTPTAVMHSAGAAGATAACGYASVYTRDRNGDLQETYLPNAGFPGDSWHTQDLSGTGGTLAGTPAILAGTSPVAIVHCGFTSVYTVDGNHNLQETYLPAIGGGWLTQDLSGTGGTLPHTPDTTTTPTAVVHTAGAAGASPGCGYTSVYTVDEGSQDLQETYLPDAGFPGDSWQTQDLSAKYHTPAVAPGTQPEALVHLGFTSVYTVDQGSDQVQETYLAAVGGGWLTQSLSAKYQTPTTNQSPIVLLHPDAGGVLDWVSVFTVDEFTAHLQETYLSNVGFPGDSWMSQDLSSTGGTMPGTPPAYVPQSSQASWSAAHDGYTSVYTRDPSGDLQETYLSAMGKSWVTQDLSGTGGDLPGTPAMLGNTVPVAVAHDGYTSVYTIDAGDSSHAKGDLQETYLKALGGPWYTQDLSQQVNTPASKVTPTAVFHDGYISVYTVDASNGNLWETYLPSAGFPGDAWHAQNLSANYRTPPVDALTSPVAIVHDGYTSIYTVDTTNAADGSTLGDLQETYLPFMGAGWSTQNLSTGYHVPLVNILTSPTAVFHDGYTSVYTVDAAASGNPEVPGDLQETYLPAMGDAWSTQDLTAKYHTPQVLYSVQPVALYHTGYTSVYTVDGGIGGNTVGDLQETYLPAMSDSWSTQDLSAKYPAIVTVGPAPSPSALVHYDTSGGLTWTSVFTIDNANGDVRENYLPAMGDSWSAQYLNTPPV